MSIAYFFEDAPTAALSLFFKRVYTESCGIVFTGGDANLF